MNLQATNLKAVDVTLFGRSLCGLEIVMLAA